MYFEKEGRENTGNVVKLALQAARERNISHIVVASCTGDTAALLKEEKDINRICVTHVNGFVEKGQNEMSEETRRDLLQSGMKVLTTTHVLSGAERSISRKFGGAYPVEVMAHTLRMLGQGVKVCVEISVMALDAGLIPYGQPVLAIAGTHEGADTCILITPSHASEIFETRINEILCKPVLFI